MPCRTVLLRKDAFDERETDFYEALYTQSQAQFGAYVETGTVLNNYAHIFDLIIRLRQVSPPFLYHLLTLMATSEPVDAMILANSICICTSPFYPGL